jgi:hypothetical protein
MSQPTHPEARAMLKSMYEAILKSSETDTQAWDRLLEFIAVDFHYPLFYQMNHRFEWLQNRGLAKRLSDHYCQDLLLDSFTDELGELYFSLGLNPSRRKSESVLQPFGLAQKLYQSGVKPAHSSGSIVDRHAGTGRGLMALHLLASKSELHGVEGDARLARIALTNCILHRVPAKILNADPNRHDINPETANGKHNWKLANRWYTPPGELLPQSR